MAKILYSVSMSLDGFIAGPGGDMSWLTDHLGPNPLVDDLLGDIGALLVGATTYGGDDPHKNDEGAGKAFGGGWEGPQYVVTHHPPDRSEPNLFFVSDLTAALDQAEAAAGDTYVNILGADIADQDSVYETAGHTDPKDKLPSPRSRPARRDSHHRRAGPAR